MTLAVWKAIAGRHARYKGLLQTRYIAAAAAADLGLVDLLRVRMRRHDGRVQRHITRVLERLEPPTPARH